MQRGTQKHCNGKGVPTNKNETALYYKIAADIGNNDTKNSYVIMQDNGDFIQIDNKETARYCIVAADKRNSDANHIYVFMLDKGQTYVMNNYVFILENSDQNEAVRCLKMAAGKGEVNAMLNYVLMKAKDDGILINKKETTGYYKITADKGYLNEKLYSLS